MNGIDVILGLCVLMLISGTLIGIIIRKKLSFASLKGFFINNFLAAFVLYIFSLLLIGHNGGLILFYIVFSTFFFCFWGQLALGTNLLFFPQLLITVLCFIFLCASLDDFSIQRKKTLRSYSSQIAVDIWAKNANKKLLELGRNDNTVYNSGPFEGSALWQKYQKSFSGSLGQHGSIYDYIIIPVPVWHSRLTDLYKEKKQRVQLSFTGGTIKNGKIIVQKDDMELK